MHEALEFHCLGRPNLEFRSGVWIEFQDKTGRRWCQVDALIFDHQAKTCLIAEVKYQHVEGAWWQLKHLYEPVLAVALPGYKFRLVEIVHWFDMAAPWPTTIRLVPSLNEEWESGVVATFIFNPKRGRFSLGGENRVGVAASGGGDCQDSGPAPLHDGEALVHQRPVDVERERDGLLVRAGGDTLPPGAEDAQAREPAPQASLPKDPFCR